MGAAPSTQALLRQWVGACPGWVRALPTLAGRGCAAGSVCQVGKSSGSGSCPRFVDQLAWYSVEPQTHWVSKKYLRAEYVKSECSVSCYEAMRGCSSGYVRAVIFE